MTETYQFALPLVAAAQAQKHVTVNAALARLDAMAQLRVVDDGAASPPAAPVDGQAHIVGPGATGAWAGRDAQIAIWTNGGWTFLAPKAGWRAWVEGSARATVHDGVRWIAGEAVVSAGGAATVGRVVEIVHTIGSGATSTVANALPAGAVVWGVTGRVTEAIGGTLTGWSLGTGGSPARYGSGLGTALNSWAAGLTGQPLAYYAATDLVLTAEGGEFAGGKVALAVHLVEILPPRTV